MIKDLIAVANSLDEKGLRKEANALDEILRKLASDTKYDKEGLELPFDEALREIEREGLPEADEELEAMIRKIVKEEVEGRLMAINQAYFQEPGGIGGFQVGPEGGRSSLIAEAKKKPTDKQLKALDLDGDSEITGKDFKLLRKRNKKSKK